MSYTVQKYVDAAFADAVKQTILWRTKGSAFAVISTFAKKLNRDSDSIGFAELVTQNLPTGSSKRRSNSVRSCNVIVHEDDDRTVTVSAVDPTHLVSITDNPDLDPISEDTPTSSIEYSMRCERLTASSESCFAKPSERTRVGRTCSELWRVADRH